MNAKKPPLTMEQKAANLIKMAEAAYLQHFADLYFPRGSNPPEEMNGAVFGFLYATYISRDDDLREVALQAMQDRFKWDDEYIATQVIGG